MHIFIKSVFSALVISFLFGEFVGLKTLSLNKLNFSPLRNIWLCIFWGAVLFILGFCFWCCLRRAKLVFELLFTY